MSGPSHAVTLGSPERALRFLADVTQFSSAFAHKGAYRTGFSNELDGLSRDAVYAGRHLRVPGSHARRRPGAVEAERP